MKIDPWQVLAAIAIAYVVLVRPGCYDYDHVRWYETDRIYRINRLTGRTELLVDPKPLPTE